MRKILILMICVVMITSTTALGFTQNTEIDNNSSLRVNEDIETWIEKYGREDLDDWGRYCEQTPDGGYILAGSSGPFEPGDDAGEMILIKVDETGQEMWRQMYGGDDIDGCYSGVRTNDGGYLLVGYTTSFGAIGFRVYVVKTDEYGYMEWEKLYGSDNGGNPENTEGNHVAKTNDGGYIIAASTRDGFGPENYFLIKLDEFGNKEWDKQIGYEDLWEVPYSVIQTNDGGYAIVGSVKSAEEYHHHNIWFVKTDEWGNVQWEQEYGGYETEEGRDIKQTPDGGYIILGVTRSYAYGTRDMIIIKTDEDGYEEWVQVYGSSGWDHADSIDLTDDGGYIMAAAYYITTAIGNDYTRPWLVKTDERGYIDWEHIYLEDNFGGLGCAHQTADGGYIAIGSITYDPAYAEKDYDILAIKTDSDGETESLSRAREK